MKGHSESKMILMICFDILIAVGAFFMTCQEKKNDVPSCRQIEDVKGILALNRCFLFDVFYSKRSHLKKL